MIKIYILPTSFSFSSSLSIRSCVIFCHIDHIISAILSSRNRKPGAEKISRFYSSSDMKVLNYGAFKEFTDRAPLSELYEKYHLTPELILEDIKKALN